MSSEFATPSSRPASPVSASHGWLWCIGGAAVLVTLWSLYTYTDLGLITGYGDSASKLNQARRVFENPEQQIHIPYLNPIWPFLPQVLMLALMGIEQAAVGSEWLYTSGMAGSIPSMVWYVGGVIALTVATWRLTDSRLAGIVAAGVWLGNLNAAYFSVAPMSESAVLGCLAFVALAVLQLEKRPQSLSWLLLLSMTLALGVLVQYELWFLVGCVAGLLGISWIRQGIKGWHLVARVGTIIWLPLATMMAWIGLWQKAIFGDWFYFATSKYSARQIDVVGQDRDYVGRPLVAVQEYFEAVRWDIGDLWVVIAGLGLLLYAGALMVKTEKSVVPLVLCSMTTFYILSLWRGQIGLSSGDDGFLHVRYGLRMLPAVAMLSGYLAWRLMGLSRYRIWHLSVLGITIGLLWPYHSDWQKPDDAVVLRGVYAQLPQIREDAMWLRQHYTDGGILIDLYPSPNDQVVYASGLLPHFISDASPILWEQALADPKAHVDWLYITSGDALSREVRTLPDFYHIYTVAYQSSLGTVYVKKDVWEALETENEPTLNHTLNLPSTH